MVCLPYFRYVFPCERWLSLETSLEANLCSVDEDASVQFESRFFSETRNRLSENHMWMSIFYRPVASNFSRVERTSCALAYILLTMVSNALYYNPGSKYELPALFEVGPFRLTTNQVTLVEQYVTQTFILSFKLTIMLFSNIYVINHIFLHFSICKI